MTLFTRRPAGEASPENPVTDVAHGEAQAPISEDAVAGDRGIPAINRARSIQSRVSSLLAIAVMSVLGLGLLSWYYMSVLTRPVQVRQAAQAAVKNRAQGEMALPRLPPVEAPFLKPTAPPLAEATSVERVLGPAPPPPPTDPTMSPFAQSAAVPMPGAVSTQNGASPQKSPRELALERRLAGPAFAHSSLEGSGGGALGSAPQAVEPAVFDASHARVAEEGGDSLNALLRPSVTPVVAASVLPTRRLLLGKGTFIDCTLETAIDSTLPGMTTCVTATDTFSADGSVVLLERGTKLVGETRGQVAQGMARIFVLWTEARTPTGVVVPLASPGTDELGRSGLSGEVNRHFWDRFGAAILLTVINGVVQGAVQSQNNGSSVIVSPSTTADVMTEVLKGTVNIPPTVSKAQGDRIEVFVARDVDFRPVYALKVANAAQRLEGHP